MKLRRHLKRHTIIFICCTTLSAASLFLILIFFPSSSSSSSSSFSLRQEISDLEYDCYGSQQGAPVFANRVEGMQYPFFISIADLGTSDKPNRNFQRMIKGKLFQKPAISQTMQSLLLKMNPQSLIIDAGANIGMAAFAAAAMGFKVLAFEPIPENLQKLCDGVYLNRAKHLVKIFQAAVSDTTGNITLHKVVGRLDNSAVSSAGAKLAFKSNQIIPLTVATVTLDSVIDDEMPVAMLKIDVQGWEYHVLKGAKRLLSRSKATAPFIIYEEDERLLSASNTTATQLITFLQSLGYTNCARSGSDRHCSKLS